MSKVILWYSSNFTEYINMSSIKKLITQENKTNKFRKAAPRNILRVKVSLSPEISRIRHSIVPPIIKKSKSNECKINQKYLAPLKISNSASNCKLSIRCIEKKIIFHKADDDLSPILSKNNKGFSMTEEELKETQLMLKNLNYE